MDKFIKIKTKAGLTKVYLENSVSGFFTPFCNEFKNCQITEITTVAAEKYLYQHKTWNPTTRMTHIRHLNVLFNFALEKGYVALNPIAKVQRPKKQTSTSGSRVVTVEQVIKTLSYAYEHGYKQECAALVLILFCGARVDEVARLTWEKIKLEEDPPVLVLDHTKTSRRRINPIPPNALEWLKLLQGKGDVTPDNYEGRMRYLRKISKSGFKQNAARISFASYHVALYEDGAKTAFLLGHSNPTLLYNNYRALLTKQEAERYWKVTPEYDGKVRNSQPTKEDIDAARMKSIKSALEKPRV